MGSIDVGHWPVSILAGWDNDPTGASKSSRPIGRARRNPIPMSREKQQKDMSSFKPEISFAETDFKMRGIGNIQKSVAIISSLETTARFQGGPVSRLQRRDGRRTALGRAGARRSGTGGARPVFQATGSGRG
jgi:hypothetical protein